MQPFVMQQQSNTSLSIYTGLLLYLEEAFQYLKKIKEYYIYVSELQIFICIPQLSIWKRLLEHSGFAVQIAFLSLDNYLSSL